GDAIQSTDDVPVAINESRAEIEANDAAYRKCGRGPLALVMVSSASYPSVTGSLPAVMSPPVNRDLMPTEKISATTTSATLESPAITRWRNAGRRAIAAGLDLALYPNTESAALRSYTSLLADARAGRLSRARVQAAAAQVLALKQSLGLSG